MSPTATKIDPQDISDVSSEEEVKKAEANAKKAVAEADRSVPASQRTSGRPPLPKEGTVVYRSQKANLMLVLGRAGWRETPNGDKEQVPGKNAQFDRHFLRLDMEKKEDREIAEILEVRDDYGIKFTRIMDSGKVSGVQNRIERRQAIRNLRDDHLRNLFTDQQLSGLGLGPNPTREELEAAADELEISI